MIELRDFKPQIHIGLAHRIACGRLAEPLAVLAKALKAAQEPRDLLPTSPNPRKLAKQRARAV